MKKILVIDDSTLMRRVMSDIIITTKEYIVAYTASNGVDGLAILEENSDIAAVFCDINMPRMNGLELLQIAKLRNINVPFIVFSSKENIHDTVTALELGAIEFIKKPERVLGKKNLAFEESVIKALKMASLSNDKINDNKTSLIKSSARTSELSIGNDDNNGKERKLVAIVCSTGGPKALQLVIPKLPKNLAAPVLVVQHMPEGFTETLANRLNDISKINVKEATNNETIKNGTVYIAKGGKHLTLEYSQRKAKIKFDDSPPVVGLKPYGNIMFESLSEMPYDEIICVVLTGMGNDGTKGIIKLSRSKKLHVIAQDEASSTVYGMPRAIYESGITNCVCDINDISEEIIKKVGVL